MTPLSSSFEIITPRGDEVAALDTLLGPALHFAPGAMREWIDLWGPENFRAARSNGRLVAGLGFGRMGAVVRRRARAAGRDHGGGRRARPARRGRRLGIAAPHARGAARRGHRPGRAVPLHAALLPAGRLRARRPAPLLRAAAGGDDVDDRALDLVPIADGQYDEVYRAYAQRARRASGNLDRPAWMWRLRLEPKDKQPLRFLVVNDGRTEGYIVFTQGGRSDPLAVLDACVLTPAAGRRMLGLLAGYRSIVEHVTWSGGPLDPLVYLLGKQLAGGARNKVKITRALDWVLRVVDVAAALSARGYAPGLSAELHLDVRDDVLPANQGRFVLQVADGRGVVTRGGEGRIRLHARDLAAIYTGFMAPHECGYLGTIAGPEADLMLAGAVFGGPRPWIADMF